MKFQVVGLFVVLSACFVAHVQAGPPPVQESVLAAADFSPFAKGTHEQEFSAGWFESILTTGAPTKPDMSYGLASYRYGWMLGDPMGSGFCRGNFEFLIGGFGGVIDQGPGDYLIGADFTLRYNFVQPNATLVPFFQIGGGGVYSNAADDDRVQRLIGSDLSFELQSALGLRWMLTNHWAITGSIQFQHISNAGLKDRNLGMNALGGLLGVGIFY